MRQEPRGRDLAPSRLSCNAERKGIYIAKDVYMYVKDTRSASLGEKPRMISLAEQWTRTYLKEHGASMGLPHRV